MDINKALKQAISYHNANRMSEAEALYRSVLKSQAGHPIASVLLAKMLLQKGILIEVESLLEGVLSEHAYYMQAYNVMGDLYETKKENSKAI